MQRGMWMGALVSCGALGLGLSGAVFAQEVELPPELARKVRELDRSGDGRIQPGEFPVELGAEVFREADRDGDGALGPRELLRMHVLREARKKRGQGKQGELQRKFREADRDGDGIITREEFPAPEMLFERFDRDGDGQVSYAEAAEFALEEEIAKVFTKHDADLSGTLSREEMPAEQKALFLVADADADGEVTGEEALNFLRELQAESAEVPRETPGSPGKDAAATGGGKLGVLGYLLGRFDAHDGDGDGRLQAGEFPASPQLLALMDADGDGALGKAELRLRLRFAEDLGKRGERLKARAKELGQEGAFAALGIEGKALFEAGRYEDVRAMMDLVELRLEQLAIDAGR